MRRFLGVLVTVLALVCGGGCVTRSSHTEGDREVNDQQKKAGEVIVEASEAAADAIDAGDYAKAKTLLEIGAAAGAEVMKNAKQQETVHGAPERADLPPFSPEASEAARKKSTDDHAGGKWVTAALTVLGAVGGIAATMAGMPWLAQFFPGLTGKIGQMAKAGVEIINTVRAKAEANGGSVDLRTVLEIARDKNVSAGIESLVMKHAHAHEEAMGMALTSLETIKDADGDGTPDDLDPAPNDPSVPARAPVPVSSSSDITDQQ